MSKPWSFACPDWEDRLLSGRPPIPDLPLDRKAADVAVRLFDALKLPDVPGQPANRDAAGDWFRDAVVAPIFGSVDPRTGRRHVGEVFVLVPKKNAKTTGAAHLALTYMLRNTRPNASLIIVAPTQKIAETAFDQAAGTIEAGLDIPDTPRSWLKDRLHVREHLKRIECRAHGAQLEIKTFDTKIVTGSKPVFVLVDETHELGTVPTADKVFRQLRGGQDPFPESVFVQITTQSDGPPQGVFKSELQYARAVRDGRLTDEVRTLPILYEMSEKVQTSADEDWRDEDRWAVVNPNLGRSTSIEKLRSGFARAEADGKTALQGWATQHLNLEAGMALHADRWIGADYWASCGDPDLTLEGILERSEVVVAGIDGGGLDDLMALSVMGRERGTRQWLHWAHAWAYPLVYERRKEIAHVLRQFEADGDLTMVETPGEEYEQIAETLLQVQNKGLAPKTFAVGIDPAQVTALIDAVVLAGVHEEGLAPANQFARILAQAIWGLEKKLLDKTITHCAQPIMAWAVGNAVAEQRGNAVMITKQTAGKAKIDPLSATIDAAMMLQLNPVAAGHGALTSDRIIARGGMLCV